MWWSMISYLVWCLSVSVGMFADDIGPLGICVDFTCEELLSGVWEASTIWAASFILPRDGVHLAVEAADLELVELYIEWADEVFEDISALRHQLCCLLIRQHFLHVLVWSLKVGKEQYEYFLGVAWDLHKVYLFLDLVEVSVEDLTAHLNSAWIEPDIHRRGPFLRNDVELGLLNCAATNAFSSYFRVEMWACAHWARLTGMSRCWSIQISCRCSTWKWSKMLSPRPVSFADKSVTSCKSMTVLRHWHWWLALLIHTVDSLVSYFHLSVCILLFWFVLCAIWNVRQCTVLHLLWLVDWWDGVWSCTLHRTGICCLRHDSPRIHVIVVSYFIIFIRPWLPQTLLV